MIGKGTINNYKVTDKLGSGDCGDVWRAVDITTGETAALKVFKDSTQTYETEVTALERVTHPRVVRMQAHSDAGEFKAPGEDLTTVSYIAMNLAPHGELFSYVARAVKMRKTEGLPEPVVRAYTRQLLEAVAACHGAGVAHRDIKLDNLLLDADFQLLLTDFGLAACENIDQLLSPGGRTNTAAPEVVRGDQYDGRLADVFSIGVVVYSMRTGTPPFRLATMVDNYYKVFKTDPARYWRLQTSALQNQGVFTRDFCAFLEKLLTHDPRQRPTCETALRLPWLQGPTADSHELRREMEQWTGVSS